ncbi:MAG: hypothetical protein H8D45_11565 [Bacteroidetes bacterium]|nr:hypothetical protein [Bacteroidota bacterium]MBL7103519.1 hypothetical protein [Bacteroidales bacterium]
MKTNNLIKACGSIIKKESLIPLDYNILKHTCVAEANFPYSDYYGMVPGQTNPNSLFLFTAHYYSLEEVLRFAQNIDSCYMEKVDVATAWLNFANHEYSAIRVKHFPDYEHIHLLQSCCIKEGVEFIKKAHMSDFALVKVNKCFVLEEIEEGIYFDKKEDHKGYITIPKQISNSKFSDTLIEIRNNNDCELFDAALGAMIIDSKATEIVRIYAEGLNLKLLECIKERFAKSILKK